MKTQMITGLTALQLFAALTLSAQTYTISVGDTKTKLRVADHIGGEELTVGGIEETIEAYNFVYKEKDMFGLMRFNGSLGSIAYAVHYGLPETTDYVRLLKGYEPFVRGAYVLGERVTAEGVVKSAVLLHFDQGDGKIISAVELAKLPPGYKLVHVFDVVEDYINEDPKRILCVLDVEGEPRLAELLYREGFGDYKVREYKSGKPPKSYLSAHYVKAYHYGRISIGWPSFYGLESDGKVNSAFCFYENLTTPLQVFEHYQFTSLGGKKGISGVQMNGSYGPNGNVNRLEMAFTDVEGGICLQQKDELLTTNWQRFYQFPNKEQFRLAWGRDGHGTKQGPGYLAGMGYFLGAWMPDEKPELSLVTALHFDGDSGDLVPPRVYDISGQSVFQKNGAIPSTSYDPGKYYSGYKDNYTFITDNLDKPYTFRYGTGNSLIDTEEKFFCSKPLKIEKAKKDRLVTDKEKLSIGESDYYKIEELKLEAYEVKVGVNLDCPAELEKLNGRFKLPATGMQSELFMDAAQLRIHSDGKAIASVRVLTIDGRSIAEASGLGTPGYEQRFDTRLTAGIYVVHIVYTDNTTEAKKVSVR